MKITEEEYLNKHRLKKEKYCFIEYDNFKSTIIASMGGTVKYKDNLYLWGKPLNHIINANK